MAFFLSSARAATAGSSGGSLSPHVKLKLTNFEAASVVIGQTNFSGGTENQGMTNPTASTISGAFGSAAIGPTGVLYLSDYNNQRILGFKSIPTSNDPEADFVLGQPNLTTAGKGDQANQFGGPQALAVYKNMLFASDFSDDRVLIWKVAPTSDDVPADIVLGQASFGQSNASCSPSGMSAPETISVGGGKLVVADSSNSRVLIYKKIPTKNGQAPDIVLGQGNLKTCVALNNGKGSAGSANAMNFSYPAGVWTDGKRLVVTDEDENRVLIWKKFPTKNFQKADIVLGQPSFTSAVVNNNGSGSEGAPSPRNLSAPYDGVFSNGTQLFVDDQMNQRILVWAKFPTKNFKPADFVLGQPNFACAARDSTGTSCARGLPSAQNFDNSTGIFQVSNQLIVNDGGNSRYLIFDGQ